MVALPFSMLLLKLLFLFLKKKHFCNVSYFNLLNLLRKGITHSVVDSGITSAWVSSYLANDTSKGVWVSHFIDSFLFIYLFIEYLSHSRFARLMFPSII